MKKIISIILVVVMISSIFCFNAFAADKMLGDANNDGEVTSMDARWVLQYAVGNKEIEDVSNLDINGDNDITTIDARMVLQIATGVINPQQEKQLEYFVTAFNNVKTNAESVTLVKVNVYEAEPYSGDEFLKSEYDQMMADMVGEKVVNETYSGDDIAMSFPPVGATCTLSMDDVKDFTYIESENYCTITFKVNGEKNPIRGKGVGAVASVVTKDDIDQMLKEEEIDAYVSGNVRYNDVTVQAKIDLRTGNMVEYYVDAPLVMEMSGLINMNMGIGTAETWKIIY